jgi:hypothetical protein
LSQAFLILGCVVLVGCVAPSTTNTTDTPAGEPNTDREMIQDRMRELFQLYEQQYTMRLVALLDDTFYGSRYQFENDLESRLRTVDSIQFDYYIEQISKGNETMEVRFHWDRRWRNTTTRSVSERTGQTTLRFVKESDDYYIQQIRGTNPFF